MFKINYNTSFKLMKNYYISLIAVLAIISASVSTSLTALDILMNAILTLSFVSLSIWSMIGQRSKFYWKTLILTLVTSVVTVLLTIFVKDSSLLNILLTSLMLISMLIIGIYYSCVDIKVVLKNVNKYNSNRLFVINIYFIHFCVFVLASVLRILGDYYPVLNIVALMLYLLIISSIIVSVIVDQPLLGWLKPFSSVFRTFDPMARNKDLTQAEALYTNLLYYMRTEHWFLEHNLTVAEVSKRILTNRSYLSKCINTCFHGNFYQFINRCRIDYAKMLFMEHPTMGLEELAEHSGFSNRAAFSVAFKSLNSLSPGAWCKAMRNKFVDDESRSHKKDFKNNVSTKGIN